MATFWMIVHTLMPGGLKTHRMYVDPNTWTGKQKGDHGYHRSNDLVDKLAHQRNYVYDHLFIHLPFIRYMFIYLFVYLFIYHSFIIQLLSFIHFLFYFLIYSHMLYILNCVIGSCHVSNLLFISLYSVW